MSDERALIDYIEKLKPVQQEFIVWCVVEYGNRPDFHRGLLPFLKCSEATYCLKTHLEVLGQAPEQAGYPGERFIKQTMSVFADHYGYKLYENEKKGVFMIKTANLKRMLGVKRISGKFILRATKYTWMQKDRLAELQMISRDRWQVTAHPDDFDAVTTFLVGTCGFASN